jgi:hypothetical protein
VPLSEWADRLRLAYCRNRPARTQALGYVACAVSSLERDLQELPRYPAGLAPRFARVEGYPPDRTASEADAIQTVSELFGQ